jgi:uncharacterized protein (TIGR02678 family)
VSRFASDISDHELATYQAAVRIVLRHPLITATWPNDRALARIRRFAATLQKDLHDAFGYRLELHGSTARLVRAKDHLDITQPARSRTDKAFDRHRYAYLMLCLAVLGRAGVQITLSELAESVAADANRVAGLGLDPDRGNDRRAFVDSVAWLEDRGALSLADGSTAAWASDPTSGEALFDIAKDVIFAIYRPTRMIQSLPSISALLDRPLAVSGNEERRAAAQVARRAVVESPVVYYSDVDNAIANHLRGNPLAEDLQRLTGLPVERRAEGVLLVDTAGLSVERFPGAGSSAQVAVLLAVEMADRVTDPDGRRVKRMDGPDLAESHARLVTMIDSGLPSGSRIELDAATEPQSDAEPTVEDGEDADGRLPFISNSFLITSVRAILQRYASAFGAQWHSDPDRLCAEAVALLARFGCVTTIPGGVLVLPLAGRYRNTVAQTKSRRPAPTLF